MMIVMRKVTMKAKATLIDSAIRIKWFMSVLTIRKLDLILRTYFGRQGRW